MRRGFITTRRSCCVHNPKNPSCFHRLCIKSSQVIKPQSCKEQGARIKKGGGMPRIIFRSHPIPPDVAPVGQCAGSTRLYSTRSQTWSCASRSLSRLLALHFHALKWQLATSPAVYTPSYHFPFHNSISVDLSTLYVRRPSLSLHLAFSPVDSLFVSMPSSGS